MAQYKIPPDPRKSDEKRPHRTRRDAQEPIPWVWLGMGVVVTIVGIGIAWSIANELLSRPPLLVSEVAPTIVVLTAPATAVPSVTAVAITPTTIPTFTPIPTPDNALAPDEITVGFYAVVANTEGFGVTIRGGPSTSNVARLVADEGTVLLVIDGPEEANTFLWWQVQLQDGTEGWAAGQFLIPTAAP
jgi:hypothetical protein